MKEIKKSKMIKNLHPKKSKTSFLDAAKTNSLEKTDYENTPLHQSYYKYANIITFHNLSNFHTFYYFSYSLKN